ncbi:hypothetical protein C8F04DRAFT_1174775 [Mycena alexandri]|uniref:Uncharacterized protein n=1 Tax=Mycena alexandri TaxID=1745969 RepID=A0AAD6TES9_9AGAR|nr:hypothetical protein C8F04DRAFT_1174775 [Mycena alexandri]
MWIAHFAPALALRPFFPNLPMWTLTMAGSLPNAVFCANAMLGIEEFRYSPHPQPTRLLSATMHRPDMVLTPTSSEAHGTSLFDSPSTIFLVELGLMALAAIPYLRYTSQKPTASGFCRNALRILAGLFVIEQFQFWYLGAPTTDTQWVHALMFLSTILTTAAVMNWVDGTRVVGTDGGKKLVIVRKQIVKHENSSCTIVYNIKTS